MWPFHIPPGHVPPPHTCTWIVAHCVEFPENAADFPVEVHGCARRLNVKECTDQTCQHVTWGHWIVSVNWCLWLCFCRLCLLTSLILYSLHRLEIIRTWRGKRGPCICHNVCESILCVSRLVWWHASRTEHQAVGFVICKLQPRLVPSKTGLLSSSPAKPHLHLI